MMWSSKYKKQKGFHQFHNRKKLVCLKNFETTQLVSCSGDKTIKFWNYESYEFLKTFQGHTGGVKSLKIV